LFDRKEQEDDQTGFGRLLETASNPDQVLSGMVLRVDNHDPQKINIPSLGYKHGYRKFKYPV
jgi:hypothetical protein